MTDFLPLLAFATCGLTLRLLLRRRDALPLDRPNERSLHVRPTPRIGGLGLSAALLACLPWLPDSAGLIGVALGLATLSLLDDVRGLPVWLRLIGHGLAAVVALGFLPDVPAWWALPVLVWMANLYNFMDGADGLAGGMAVFGFAAYGIAAWLGGAEAFALLAWVIAAAAAGFLLFNFPPARLFLGDAGSVPLGFLTAALGLAGITAGVWPPVFPLLVFSPFIVDASVTLLRRAWRGEKVWQAHREHYYQRLVRLGWSHRRLALAEYAVMAAAGASGLALLRHPDWQAGMLALWGACYLVVALGINHRWRGAGMAD